MRTTSFSVAIVAALGLAACPGDHNDAIPCADSTICNIETGGQCLASPLGVDLCAYPTADCASGLEWGPHSGSLSSECVASDVDASVIDAPIDAGIDGPSIDAPTDGPDIDAMPGGPIVVNSQPADLVLGQSSFISSTENTGGASASSLRFPNGIAADGSSLWVLDSGNGRALRWDPLPVTGFAPASLILGRATFTDISQSATVAASNLRNDCCRHSIAAGAGRVAIADSFWNRVLVWNPAPASNGVVADFALGQPGLTSGTAGTSATTLREPSGVWTNGTRIVVADTNNHRVLIWNTFPTTNGQAADLVLGQPDFTSGAAGAASASSMFAPRGVYVDGARLYVADSGNQRILIWNTFPTANGQAADLVLGQPDFATINTGAVDATTMSYPQAVVVAGGALFVADRGNDRVMVYTPIPTASNAAASLVLGHPNLNTPGGSAVPPTQTNLDGPIGLVVADRHLYVTDKEHHRVMRFALNL